MAQIIGQVHGRHLDRGDLTIEAVAAGKDVAAADGLLDLAHGGPADDLELRQQEDRGVRVLFEAAAGLVDHGLVHARHHLGGELAVGLADGVGSHADAVHDLAHALALAGGHAQGRTSQGAGDLDIDIVIEHR